MSAFRPSAGSRPRPRPGSRRRLLIATAAVGAAIALAAPGASAADFSEDFDPGVAAGQPWTPVGWSQSNQSFPIGSTGWFQGNPPSAGLSGPFDAHQGVASSYIGANFNGTTGGTGTISNWLISPQITTLTNGDVVSFYTRSAGAAYADRMELRLSSDGTCTPGPGATAVGSFSTLLVSINPELAPTGYPGNWTEYTVKVTGLPASTAVSGCLGFRYWVTGAGPVGSNSDYIGIDSFRFVEDVVAPVDPTISNLTPNSPGRGTPKATGAAEAGSTVRIYGDSACTGTVLGTGTATAFNGGLGVAFTVADNATVTPYATATDDSGNVSDCSAAGPTYVEDSIAPVTGDDVPTGWQTAVPAVTLTATDTNGVAHTYYEVGADPALPTTASPEYDPAHKPTLGNGQKIRYFSVDAAGNEEQPHGSGAVQVDLDPPVTGDDVPTGWVGAAPVVTLDASDPDGSGVAHTYYEVGADPALPTTASPEYDPAHKPTLSDGQKIRYFSVDAVGHAETPRSSPAAQVDLTAPVTGDDVPAGWVDAKPTITLDAADPDGSGVAHTYYEVGTDPAAPTAASSEYDPADKPTLGNGQKIRYFSVDAAGNEETPHSSEAAQVDLDAPVTSDDVPAGWVGAAPVVTLDASDPDGSGVAHTYYEIGVNPTVPTTASPEYDPAHKPTLEDGEKIRYFSVDAVGHAEAWRSSDAAQVDLAAPVTGDDVPVGWVDAKPAVTLDAADPDGSGVAHTYYEVGVNPAVPTAASPEYDPAHKPTLGNGQKIRYFSVDAVGNAEAPRSSGTAQVDLDAPVTGDDVPAGWVGAAPVVTLDASDPDGSGVARTYYEVGANPTLPTTASSEYDPAHKPTLSHGERIRYFSVDVLGHAATPRSSAAAKVDRAAPATSDDVTAATAPGASVSLAASDTDSGVAATYYTVGVDPAVPTTASRKYDAGDRPVLAAGERIRYFSVDAVGNAEQPHSSVAVSIPPAPDPRSGPQPKSEAPPQSTSPRGPVRVTQVASDARCLGSVRGARREITVRYTTIETTRLTLTLQRRITRSSQATPTGCPAVAPKGAGPDSRGGKAIAYATVTAGASPRAVRGARKLALVRTDQPGKHALPLLRTFRITSLAPGRYRLQIQATNADGTTGRTSYVHFWVLAARK